MDTQQAIDALTDHMAIYHRSTQRPNPVSPRPVETESRPNTKFSSKGSNAVRQRVIEWLSGLTVPQRRGALTVVDKSWVLLLLQMQEKLDAYGPGNFIVLPDVPAPNTSRDEFVGLKSWRQQKGNDKKGNDKKGRASSNSRRSRSQKYSRSDNGDSIAEFEKIDGDVKSMGVPVGFKSSPGMSVFGESVSLPGLCYRKANGLLARLTSQQIAGERLLNGVQVFSSQDGEKRPMLSGFPPGYDCLTVTDNFVKNLDNFLEVMDELSYGDFLEYPLGMVASSWEETQWLQVQGYYSMAAFVANKLEISIWSSYTYSLGSKRPTRSLLGGKTSEASKNSRSFTRAVDVFETAAVAQSVHGRKRGYIDWWDQVGNEVKEKTVNSALAAATKSEVLQAIESSKSTAENSKSAKGTQRSSGARKIKGKTLKWASLSDTEADHLVQHAPHDLITSTMVPLLAGLTALKTVAESGFFSRESSSPKMENDTLFHSNLRSVHTLSDRVVRKTRDVLARVMNEAVETELLEGELGVKPPGADSGKPGAKGSKEKKKRRKRSSTLKVLPQEGKEPVSVATKPLEESRPVVREDCKEMAALQSQRAALPLGNGMKTELGVEKLVKNKKGQGRKTKVRKEGKALPCSNTSSQNGNCAEKTVEQLMRDSTHAQSGEDSSINSSSLSIKMSQEGVLDTRNDELSTSKGTDTLSNRHIGSSRAELDICGDDRRASTNNEIPDFSEQPLEAASGAASSNSMSYNGVEKLTRYTCNGHFLPPSEVLKPRVLSPVGEEPTFSLVESEVSEVLQPKRVSEAPLYQPTNKPGIIKSIEESNEVNSITLRFGTIDFSTTKIEKPSVPSLTTDLEASILMGLHQEGSDKMPEKIDTGYNKVVVTKGEDQGYQSAGKKRGTEPVVEPSIRRSGVRSQSLPTGILTTGKKVAGITRPTQAFFTEEPLLVRNLKPGQLRTQRTAPAFAMFYSHEWPGYPQVRLSGANVRPTATERLHLDVIHDWPKRIGTSPVALTNRKSIPQTPPVSLEWPPGYSLTPMVGYSDLTDGVVTLSPFSSSPFASRNPPGGWQNGHSRAGAEFEGEDHTDDTDLEVFEPYAGDYEDFDGYIVSEEEGEQQVEDMKQVKAEDYNKFFGGGVMYWNSADYAGMGYSRPGSMSSDDSSWARREADLSVVLDDIVGLHPLPGSYRNKGSNSLNLSSTSPSQPSSSLPLSFEHLGNTQIGPRVCLTRPTDRDFPLSYGTKSDDSQASGSNAGATIGVLDGIMSDGFMPRLRPIVVVRDPGLTRSDSKNEAVRLQEARSPHIVPRGTRDILSGRRRRPSPPIIRHAPPPPPPSPVAGPKRRKGWMSARSGSSSPRHWGLTSWWNKDEVDGFEAHAISRDGIVGNGRRRGCLASTSPLRPLSGAVLREHLVAIPPLALDQEHMADEALPMQSSVLYNKNPSLHLAITLLHTAIHKEIEAFCIQVAAEKRMRMPFINTAVKKVAHSLQVLWPRSRTKIFGSNATGLALPTSDVDLVVSLPPVRKAREPIKQAGILEGRIDGVKETCLLHAARNLEDQEWVESLQVIEHTVVPIIRLVVHILPHQCELGDISLSVKETERTPSSRSENMEVGDGSPTSEEGARKSPLKEGSWGSETDRQFVRLDISFEAPANTGLRTSELVRELMGQFPPITPLALVLKQFLADRSLDHPYKGGLSSYCQVLLITRFFQHQQHLGRPSSSQSLGCLFMDFLHFFGCVFDPRRMCVRIRAGGMYVSRDRGLSIDPLYIEDPLDYVNNVGSTCFRIQQIVKAFADAYAALEKELFEASTVEGAKEGNGFNLLQKIIPSTASR